MSNYHRKRIEEYILAGDRDRLTEVLMLVRGCDSYRDVLEIIKEKEKVKINNL
jgi:hypothetical protein